MNNALEIKGLRKKRGNFVLGEVSFDLPSGCILGILGENGAGKSTMINTMLGVLKKDAGTVRVLGCDDLYRHPEVRAEIGFVLDPPGLPDVLNAKDLNAIYRDTYSTWRTEEFFRLLKQLDVPADKQIRSQSKGTVMKLACICALCHEAKLLVMDEPTSGLDPAARTELINILYDYTKKEDRTVILSSHITGDLEKTADLILILHEGKILEYAPKDELLDRYRYVIAGPGEFDRIDPTLIKASRMTAYSTEALVCREAVRDGMEVRPASLEEIFTSLVKGVI